MKIMKCGECGCTAATLRAEGREGFDGYEKLELTCVNCGGITMFQPYAAIQEDRNVGEGSFTTGWHNDKDQDDNEIDRARRKVLEDSIGMKTYGPLPKLTDEGERLAYLFVEKAKLAGVTRS
jgi:hypothetical protein